MRPHGSVYRRPAGQSATHEAELDGNEGLVFLLQLAVVLAVALFAFVSTLQFQEPSRFSLKRGGEYVVGRQTEGGVAYYVRRGAQFRDVEEQAQMEREIEEAYLRSQQALCAAQRQHNLNVQRTRQLGLFPFWATRPTPIPTDACDTVERLIERLAPVPPATA